MTIHLAKTLIADVSLVPFQGLFQRTPWGVEKRGEGKPHEWHPSQKGVLDPPPRAVRFPHPVRCQCSVFPVQKATTEQTRSSFGGVQQFSGERVLWHVFLPHTFSWRTFRIFLIFCLGERGMGSPRRQEGGGVRFLLNIPGGGSLRRGEEGGWGRGAGRASAGNLGGGG